MKCQMMHHTYIKMLDLLLFTLVETFRGIGALALVVTGVVPALILPIVVALVVAAGLSYVGEATRCIISH